MAQLLYKFKQTVQLIKDSKRRESQVARRFSWMGSTEEPLDESRKATEYLLQSSDEARKALFEDFESMFPGGKGEAAEVRVKRSNRIINAHE